MRIYLAGSYMRHAELFKYAGDLTLLGHECTSTWLRIANDPQDDGRTLSHSRQEAAQIAAQDLVDIERSDLVVCFTEPVGSQGTRGGRHYEAGYAAGRGKPVWIVGPLEHVFYAATGVRCFSCWTACRAELTPRLLAPAEDTAESRLAGWIAALNN